MQFTLPESLKLTKSYRLQEEYQLVEDVAAIERPALQHKVVRKGEVPRTKLGLICKPPPGSATSLSHCGPPCSPSRMASGL